MEYIFHIINHISIFVLHHGIKKKCRTCSLLYYEVSIVMKTARGTLGLRLRYHTPCLQWMRTGHGNRSALTTMT